MGISLPVGTNAAPCQEDDSRNYDGGDGEKSNEDQQAKKADTDPSRQRNLRGVPYASPAPALLAAPAHEMATLLPWSVA